MLNNIFMWQANIVMYIINVIYLNEYIKSKFMRLCDYNASPVHCLGRKRKVLTSTIIHSFGLIGKNHGFISIEVSNALFIVFSGKSTNRLTFACSCSVLVKWPPNGWHYFLVLFKVSAIFSQKSQKLFSINWQTSPSFHVFLFFGSFKTKQMQWSMFIQENTL